MSDLPKMFHLFKVSGYEEAIMSLRMSHGKYFSIEKAQDIQDLVYAVTDKRGLIATESQYVASLCALGVGVIAVRNYGSNSISKFEQRIPHPKITGNYGRDVAEFKRLLGLTMNNAMGEFDHHTLMKYIDISFFTVGLHRGAQDDLDAHAMGFNNRITRYSTRLAKIEDTKLSAWYEDKIIPLHDVNQMLIADDLYDKERYAGLPTEIDHNGNTFKYTPFGYVLMQYADMAEDSGLRKDVVRGGMALGMASNGLWKSDLFNMRYIYYRRSKLTKANPELKIGMEQLFDQLEQIPVFGEHVRHELTDSGEWEHINKVRTVTREEYDMVKKIKEGKLQVVEM